MLEKLNFLIFEFINKFAGENFLLDKTAVIFAKYLLLLPVAISLFLFFKKEKEYKKIAVLSFFSAFLGLLVNKLISLFYFHPRPFMISLGRRLIYHSWETSFPSGHTTFVLTLALMLIYWQKTRRLGFFVLFLGILIGLARVFCGVHFPLDILGSAGVAFLIFITFYFFRKANFKTILRVFRSGY